MTGTSKLKNLQKTLERLDIEREIISEQIEDAKKRKYIRCESSIYGDGCGARLIIGTLTYIQTHYYEQPYSCMGGDQWYQSEGQFDCPKCGLRNRLYKRKKYENLKYSFKNVENEYKRSY